MMMLSVAIIAALVSVSHVEGAFFTLDVVEVLTRSSILYSVSNHNIFGYFRM